MTQTLKKALEDRVDYWLERLFPGMNGRQTLTLYLVTPLAIGALLGWYRAGYATNYPLAISLFEWTVNFFTLWIAFDLGSRAIAFLFRVWSAQLWLVLILGGIAGLALSQPLRVLVSGIAGNIAPNAQPDLIFPAGTVWQEYVFAYASVTAMPILIWVLVNILYARTFGVPRYGYHSQKKPIQTNDDSHSPIRTPEFVKRLSLGTDAEIWALQAEDHYLRVYSEQREDLIRYRFSDAVNELHGVPGLQVHRSFWINTEVIDSIKRAGRSYEIVLKSGLAVPVSRSYRHIIREAGLLTRFPSRPVPLFPRDFASNTKPKQISSI